MKEILGSEVLSSSLTRISKHWMATWTMSHRLNRVFYLGGNPRPMSLSLTATTTDNVILVIVVICPSILVEKPTMHDVLTKMVWLDVRQIYVWIIKPPLLSVHLPRWWGCECCNWCHYLIVTKHVCFCVGSQSLSPNSKYPHHLIITEHRCDELSSILPGDQILIHSLSTGDLAT